MAQAFETAQDRFNALGRLQRTLILDTLTGLQNRQQAASTEDMKTIFQELGSLSEIAQDCYGAMLLGKFQPR